MAMPSHGVEQLQLRVISSVLTHREDEAVRVQGEAFGSCRQGGLGGAIHTWLEEI